MANGVTRTQIRQIRRRFGWRVVFVQAVGEYLQLERADSARCNESKIVPCCDSFFSYQITFKPN